MFGFWLLGEVLFCKGLRHCILSASIFRQFADEIDEYGRGGSIQRRVGKKNMDKG